MITAGPLLDTDDSFLPNNRILSERGTMTGPFLSPMQKKISLSLFLLVFSALAFSPLLPVIIENSPIDYWDHRAETYLEKTMARAALTFALVRGLNGIVSVAQGTEIAVSPAGVGLNVSIGEILDPINDLAERFSWVMLLSTVSLGIQRVILEMGNWLGLQVLLASGLLIWATGVWKRDWGVIDLKLTARRVILLAIAVRFFIPTVAVVSNTVYDRFLNHHYREASETLTRMSEELKQFDPGAGADPDMPSSEGLVQEFQLWLAETQNLVNIRSQIDLIKAKLERFTEDTIRLMVIFTLQTVLIPLVIMWILGRMMKPLLTPFAAHHPSHAERLGG